MSSKSNAITDAISRCQWVRFQQIAPSNSRQAKGNPTGVLLSNIKAETGRLLNASLTYNTRKAYSTGFTTFNSFRENFNLQEFWPPTLEQITQFIAYMFIRNFSCMTAELYVAAVSFQCKIRSVSDTTKHFLVTKLLEGFRRVGLPIALNLLHSMLTRILAACFNSYESSLFATAFTLAFCGFLRVGELAVEKKKGSDGNKVLAIGDVTFSANNESMYVRIRYSKADQAGVGVTLKFSQTRDAIYPVQYMRSFLLVRPKVVGPLFCHVDGSPLTRFQLKVVLDTVFFFNL